MSTPPFNPPQGHSLEGSLGEVGMLEALCDSIRDWTCELGFRLYRPEDDPSEGTAQGLRPDEAELVAPAVSGGMVPRNVVSGYVEVKRIQHWPFVLVSFAEFDDSLPYSTIVTRISTGVYDPDEALEGWQGAFLLLRTIKRKIFGESVTYGEFGRDMASGSPGRVLASNEVTHPFYMAETSVVWYYQTPFVQEESGEFVTNPVLTPRVDRETIIPGAQHLNLPTFPNFGQPT